MVWPADGPRVRVVAAARTFRRTVAVAGGGSDGADGGGGAGTRAEVVGLGHVASDPAFRGLGLGARVVRAAFDRLAADQAAAAAAAAAGAGAGASAGTGPAAVDQGRLRAAPVGVLFQTGVGSFYEKLGARVLPATAYPVSNGTGRGRDAKRRGGFWDPTVGARKDR